MRTAPTAPVPTIAAAARASGIDVALLDAAMATNLSLVDWSEASCLMADPEQFFPGKGMNFVGKAVCDACPLTAACLRAGLEQADVNYGNWGGHSTRTRRDARKVLVEGGLLQETFGGHDLTIATTKPLPSGMAERIAADTGQDLQVVLAAAPGTTVAEPEPEPVSEPDAGPDELAGAVVDIDSRRESATGPMAILAGVDLTEQWVEVARLPVWTAWMTEGPHDHRDAQVRFIKNSDGTVAVMARRQALAA